MYFCCLFLLGAWQVKKYKLISGLFDYFGLTSELEHTFIVVYPDENKLLSVNTAKTIGNHLRQNLKCHLSVYYAWFCTKISR